MSRITSVKEARAAIGKQVWWEESGGHYTVTRTGYLEEVEGRNVMIEGNWLWRADLIMLRDTKESAK